MAGQFCLNLSGFNRYHTTDPAKQSGSIRRIVFLGLIFYNDRKIFKKDIFF
jgi:hypothetical protein